MNKIIISLPLLLLYSVILSYRIDTAEKNQCHKWYYPSKENIQQLISSMTLLNGPEHCSLYSNYSCSIENKLIYKGKEYKYYLNAGVWISVVSLDYKD
jgi:hypothetical protein